jgi:hypothetical protein
VSQAAALAKDWICPNCLSDQTAQRLCGSFSSLIKKGVRQGVTYHALRYQLGSPVRRKYAESTPLERPRDNHWPTAGDPTPHPPHPPTASPRLRADFRVGPDLPARARPEPGLAIRRCTLPVAKPGSQLPAGCARAILSWPPTQFRARSGKHAKNRANSFRESKLWPGGPQDPVSAMVFALGPRGWRPASVPMNSYSVARLRSRGFACACG